MSPSETKHKNCPVEIRFKFLNGTKRQGKMPGLFCACHDKWIKWLSDEDADYAIDNLNVPIARYIPRDNLSYTQYIKTKKSKRKQK